MSELSENRGIALPQLPKLIALGFSGRGAERFLMGQGIGYKREDFIKDWREAGDFEKKKDTFKYIRKDYRPDVKTQTLTSENLSKEFSYVAKVGAQSKITGEIEYHEWRYATDDLISIADAEAAIQEETEEPYVAGLEWDHISVEIIGCKKRMVL
ncbi:hypothetical protein ES708_19696 [subsurface metagenome]